MSLGYVFVVWLKQLLDVDMVVHFIYICNLFVHLLEFKEFIGIESATSNKT